ncbi:MFS transporter [Rhodothalassium salexigens]|uniref:efflux RND transporter permease subunit n=1 Tax=Rhodothalassium salexigens TaxID=1086 RepID=UPI0019141980|nr:MFS transporter [Rhodothalassium salexigens]
MNAIIAAAIEYKRLVMTLLVLVLVAGLWGYDRIPKENNPEVQVPFFSVTLTHTGISPEDAERLLIKPMEKELKTLEGLKEMVATGYEGGASISLEFLIEADPDVALAEIREKVDLARSDLPDETEEPVVEEYFAADQPVVEIVLSGALPERELVALARDLKDRIEGIPMVVEAKLTGDRDEVMEVLVDPVKLETYDLSLTDVVRAVQNNNQLVAAGAMELGPARYPIKIPGLIEDVPDVAALPIKVSDDGDGVVTLADVATGRRTFKDATSYARFNGQPALRLEVYKRAKTNALATANQIKAVTDQARSLWPETLTVTYSYDGSEYVVDFMGTLRNSVLSAVLLVAVVVVAALGARSAGLVGVSIPGSFLLGILVLYALGYSINVVVLFGLILAVGLLVDGAIVVTEYADRKMLEGFDREAAFRMAAQRMAWPITASTMTTLAAFFPILFWPGIMGEFMSYIPLTLIFVLTGSLLMALIFLPTVGSIIGRPGEGDPNVMESLSGNAAFDPDKLSGITGRYARLLARLVRHPWKLTAATFAVLLGVWVLFAADNEGMKLFPEVPPEAAEVVVHARGNLSIDEKDRLVRDVEARLQGIDGVEHISTRVGAGRAEDTIGAIRLIYYDWDQRAQSSAAIEAEVRRRIADVAGVRVQFRAQEGGPVQGKDIAIQVRSEQARLVEPAVAKLRGFVDAEMDGLVDVEDSRPVPGIEWELSVDRTEVGRYGTDVATVGRFLQLVTNGALAGTYRPDTSEDEVDIRVRLPDDARGLDALDTIRVATPHGQVPVSNFVVREAQNQVGEIERVGGKRMMSVSANVAEGQLPPEQVARIRDWLATQDWDPRLSFEFKGQDEQEQEATAFLSEAFIGAVFLMGLILIAQFNSFYHAFLILTAVVLSTIGVVFGLWAMDRPFVLVMSGIGIIALAGIVVNNNIVLIDTYARLVKSGCEPLDAIVRTGAQRLRPVILTTVTTIIGLTPMIFQVNIDLFTRSIEYGSPTSFFWVDLSIAIAFGLAFATVLTLLVTPGLLALRIQVKDQLARRRARKHSSPPADRDDGLTQLPEAAE